jgi:hypothetical protein
MFLKTNAGSKIASHPRRKGFVGPLGDDIPSIFPIVAGVLLFIGTLVYAFGLVQEKNQYLEIRRAGMTLSYIMTEKGVMPTEAEFKAKCDLLLKTADTNRVYVLVTLKRYCKTVELFQGGPGEKPELSPFFVEKFSGDAEADSGNGRTWLYCSNDENVAEGGFQQPKNAVLLNYPIAVPCPTQSSPTRGVGLINVIVWR